MEFEDFVAKVKPKGARTRMESLKAHIFQLEAMDYAYWQICMWLQLKGVDVSLDALKEFIELRKVREPPGIGLHVPQASQHAASEPDGRHDGGALPSGGSRTGGGGAREGGLTLAGVAQDVPPVKHVIESTQLEFSS